VENTFYLTAAVLAVAAVVGLLANMARQPLIVAYILVGILVGPSALGWVEDAEPLELFAEIGIAMLLFLVGLRLDLHLVRTTGRVALVTGLGQVVFTSVIGFLLALGLGLDVTAAAYVAIALTFSSTIIIVKLLSDKRELEELHGRIALGFLIVQDIVVVLVMIVLASTTGTGGRPLGVELMLVLAQGVALLGMLAALMRWVLPRVLGLVAASPELMIVFAVAWAVSMASAGEWLGFSSEVGAFLAGFALASTPYREAIASSLTGLRDFLLLFFFIELGSGLDFSAVGAQVPAAVLLSVFVLVGNPVIVLVIMGVMRYPRRVSFLAGLAVAQISEFSLILIALGYQLGHVGSDTVGLVTLVGVVTIGVSTYLIIYSHPIYERLAPWLKPFERSRLIDHRTVASRPVDVIVFGYGRFGSRLAHELVAAGKQVLVVDWDPNAQVPAEHEDAVTVVFGDAEDSEFPGSLPLSSAEWVVSTIPRVETTRVLVHALRRWGHQGKVAVTAHSKIQEQLLGPDLAGGRIHMVLNPFASSARQAAGWLVAE
jgi:Kef-type K+ transport system membrane component KefB